MRSLLTAALIPAAVSAHMLGTARVRVDLRATTTTMDVKSWVESVDTSVTAANPQLVEQAFAYEADIAAMQARLDSFGAQRGTMVGACATAIP